MTAPTTFTFGKLLIKLGDGADPEVFGAPCGLTSKNWNQTANAQETIVPDCDDPDAPANVERAIDSLSREFSGGGVLTEEAFTTWQAWFDSGLSKNCRVYPMGASGGYYSGGFVLTQFNVTGQRGQKLTVDVTGQSDGACPWTPGS